MEIELQRSSPTQPSVALVLRGAHPTAFLSRLDVSGRLGAVTDLVSQELADWGDLESGAAGSEVRVAGPDRVDPGLRFAHGVEPSGPGPERYLRSTSGWRRVVRHLRRLRRLQRLWGYLGQALQTYSERLRTRLRIVDPTHSQRTFFGGSRGSASRSA